jgi:hypothetical protein
VKEKKEIERVELRSPEKKGWLGGPRGEGWGVKKNFGKNQWWGTM